MALSNEAQVQHLSPRDQVSVCTGFQGAADQCLLLYLWILCPEEVASSRPELLTLPSAVIGVCNHIHGGNQPVLSNTWASCVLCRSWKGKAPIRYNRWGTDDNTRYWMLGAGALGRPRGMEWGGRREEGSRWGTHVYLWQIHFDIWQN